MLLKDPCKICLVNAICNKPCSKLFGTIKVNTILINCIVFITTLIITIILNHIWYRYIYIENNWRNTTIPILVFWIITIIPTLAIYVPFVIYCQLKFRNKFKYNGRFIL